MLTFRASNRGILMDCRRNFDQLTAPFIDLPFPLFDSQFGILKAIHPPFPI